MTRWPLRARLTALIVLLVTITGVALLSLIWVLVVPLLPEALAWGAPLSGSGLPLETPATQPAQHIIALRAKVMSSLLVRGGAALGCLMIVSAGAGWIIAGRVLRRLHAVTATARRVAEENLHERIALDGPPDEIGELADTFDFMVQRLERSFDGQRRFIANASHELRTPLTTTRTVLEVAMNSRNATDEILRLGEKVLAANAAQERLLDGLLALAQSSETINRDTRVDLADLLRDAVREHAEGARQASIRIDTDLCTAPAIGDRTLLERVTHNLIDNAIRYNTESGGWISVRTGVTDGQAGLLVRNSGPVLSADDSAALFQPFRRLHFDRSHTPRGNGLGLSIVRAVAEAHQGTATALAHDDGGLTVQVLIPTTPGFR